MEITGGCLQEYLHMTISLFLMDPIWVEECMPPSEIITIMSSRDLIQLYHMDLMMVPVVTRKATINITLMKPEIAMGDKLTKVVMQVVFDSRLYQGSSGIALFRQPFRLISLQ